MCCSYFVWCLIISIGTIIQTVPHLGVIVYAYLLRTCVHHPKGPHTILFYLTYLYNKKCGNIEIHPPESTGLLYTLTEFFSNFTLTNLNSTYNTTHIIEEILDKANFPDNSDAYSRTYHYLLCFIILDSCWIISAVALLMGTCFRIKESLSLIFYGPWLVITTLMVFLDVSASVQFGFDFSETSNFHDWMRFVGIQNPDDLADLDDKNPSHFFPISPTIAMCSISSRFVALWIYNVISLLIVLRATTLVFKEKFHTARHAHEMSLRSSQKTLDLDTSAARIRNWQLFYGTSEPSSNDTAEETPNRVVQINISLNNTSESRRNYTATLTPPTPPNLGEGDYHQYSDVAEDIYDEDSVPYLKELKRHLPFSYFPKSQENKDIGSKTMLKSGKRLSMDNSIEMQGRWHNNVLTDSMGKKTFTILSNSSRSSTGSGSEI